MRLSEAIRLGAMLRPQAFGGLWGLLTGESEREKSCALGAAAEAIGAGQEGEPEAIERLRLAFGATLDSRRRRCPVAMCRVRRTTGNVIAHLNDTHRWTREQIADWVQTFEQSADNPRASPLSVDAVREDPSRTSIVASRA